MEKAKVLFNALNNILPEERELLTEKYYMSNQKANYDPKRDLYRTIIAVKNHRIAFNRKMSKAEVKKQVSKAESNLENEMHRVYQMIHDKAEEFKLMIGNGMYFKGYAEGKEVEEYILSKKEGRVFKEFVDRKIYSTLIDEGFKKVPI